MPRKKRDPNDIELVPEGEFEDAFRALLNAPKEKVEEQIEEIHAENVERRQRKRKEKP